MTLNPLRLINEIPTKNPEFTDSNLMRNALLKIESKNNDQSSSSIQKSLLSLQNAENIDQNNLNSQKPQFKNIYKSTLHSIHFNPFQNPNPSIILGSRKIVSNKENQSNPTKCNISTLDQSTFGRKQSRMLTWKNSNTHRAIYNNFFES